MNLSLRDITGSIFKSYSQIFFSENLWFGIILFITSFLDVFTGFSGLLAVITTIILAYLLKFNWQKIRTGVYGFNSLLVGLGTGYIFEPSFEVIVLLIFISILSFFITIATEGVLAKYRLAFYSIPFLIVIWLINLASSNLGILGLSEREIYSLNEMYSFGGQWMIDIYNWSTNLPIAKSLKVYFLSLAAIIFQFNVPTGILISLFLLVSSRIAFTLSLLGYYLAYAFYYFWGIDFNVLSYTYIGFNYILTAIVIGGFSLIASRFTYLWVILLLPVTIILTFGLSTLFVNFNLYIYSLPFNIIVILFLYCLKINSFGNIHLIEPIIQQNSPEKNLYSYQINLKRFYNYNYFPIYLPVIGKWNISQGHNDKYTHKNDWQHAWDFVIVDKTNKEYRNSGKKLNDYYCYEKPIIAPADGYIVEIQDGIDDNKINTSNTYDNWGNSIVIKHTPYLYSQLSHLKKNSFKVKKGDFVKKGKILALLGNSGRSPYPHLHFQLQSSTYIGSRTIDYPIVNYLINKQNNKYQFKSYSKPLLNETITNISPNSLLVKALNFMPDQVLKYQVKENTINLKEKGLILNWKVYTDIYNVSHIYCSTSKSYLYIKNDGILHHFTEYSGKKNTLLYYFYLSLYKVQQGFYKDLSIDDYLPPNKIFNRYWMFLHDFIAPFYSFLKAVFTLNYIDIDNEISPSKISLKSKIDLYLFRMKKNFIKSKILISKKGIEEIDIHTKKGYIKAICID